MYYDTSACTIDCCGSFPKEPIISTLRSAEKMALYKLWSPEPKIIDSTSPGPDLPTDATPRRRSVLGGPSPRRGNTPGFRRTFEAQGLGAHVDRRAWTAPPRPRTTALTSPRSFVSRRHKFRGDPRCRTGFQCGQFITRETSQRRVIKVYIYCNCIALNLSLIHI